MMILTQNETIKNMQDIMEMLDALLRSPKPFWDEFYADREKKVPFFVNVPDENLVSYVVNKLIPKGKVLDIGCGAGRNALYLTKQGFEVTGVDLSEEAINWAKERAFKEGLDITFLCQSVFDLEYENTYDFIFDSGCLHHIYPHRRIQYIDFLTSALKPGGKLGINCFAPGYHEGTSGHMSDWEVYRELSMKGGLSYSKERLVELFGDRYELLEFRQMNKGDNIETFGVEFMSVSLWEKRRDK